MYSVVLKPKEAMPNPQFLQSRTAHGPSGTILAYSLYDFSVDDKTDTAEVSSSAMIARSGQMEPQESKLTF